MMPSLSEFLLSSGIGVVKIWTVGWMPAFINQVFLGHSCAHLFMYYLWLLSCYSEGQNCNKDPTAHRSPNVHYLAIYRKSVQSFVITVFNASLLPFTPAPCLHSQMPITTAWRAAYKALSLDPSSDPLHQGLRTEGAQESAFRHYPGRLWYSQTSRSLGKPFGFQNIPVKRVRSQVETVPKGSTGEGTSVTNTRPGLPSPSSWPHIF